MVDTDRYRPRFSEREVLELAKRHYDLSGSLRPLPSERDQNFRLQTESDRFVLKIHAADERREVLDLQNSLMTHVAKRAPGLQCPRLVPTRDALPMAEAAFDSERSFFVRLLTYVPGTPLAEHRRRNRSLHVALGKAFGELDRALEDLEHPAAPTDFYWDIRNAAPTLAEHVGRISDPTRRQRIERLIHELDDGMQQELDQLPRSIIHNDGNDYNVLLVGGASNLSPNIGVIDFGDVVHSATVIDLAVTAAYALMGSNDPLVTLAELVSGYELTRPLGEAERQLLPDLIRLRLGLSVTLSAYRKTLEPDNAYLTISEKPGWELLEQLEGLPRPLVQRSLLPENLQASTISRTPTPVMAPEGPPHHPLEQWLGEGHGSAPWKALDLSVESQHLDAAVLMGDASPTQVLDGL